MAGTKELKPSESGAGESGVASRTLDRAGFGTQPTEQVIVTSASLKAGDPEFRAVVDDVMGRLAAARDVEELRSPYDERTISADGHSALISFEIPGTQNTAGDKVAPALAATAAAAAAHPGFTIGQAGEASFAKVYDETQGEDFKKAETLSLPLTLLILVFAFGGLVAAGIPVLLAMSAVGAAGGLTALTSHLLPVTDVTQSVILLIGLAVGVDYSIFYLARERRERAQGKTTVDAIEIAAATSGRAVLVSGLTVIVAMSGMFLSGNSLFAGLAVGTILVVLCAVIGSLTVLPALLAPKSAGVPRPHPGRRRGRPRVPRRRPRHRRRVVGHHLAAARPRRAACAAPRASGRSGSACSAPCCGIPSSRWSRARPCWSRWRCRRSASRSASPRPPTACPRTCPSCRPRPRSTRPSPARRRPPSWCSRPTTSPRPRSTTPSAASSRPRSRAARPGRRSPPRVSDDHTVDGARRPDRRRRPRRGRHRRDAELRDASSRRRSRPTAASPPTSRARPPACTTSTR